MKIVFGALAFLLAVEATNITLTTLFRDNTFIRQNWEKRSYVDS